MFTCASAGSSLSNDFRKKKKMICPCIDGLGSYHFMTFCLSVCLSVSQSKCPSFYPKLKLKT